MSLFFVQKMTSIQEHINHFLSDILGPVPLFNTHMPKTTQAERERNEHRNIRVVNDFKNYWDDRGVDLRQSGSGLVFTAQVYYDSPKAIAVERTEVRISLSGYGTDGAIDILEAGDLKAVDFHLGFVAAFGAYKLDKTTGEISFSNTSSKMGGEFTVRIVPLV